MNQTYAEAGVKRKDTPLTLFLRFIMIVGIVVGFLLILLGSLFSIAGIVMAALLIYFYRKLNVDYEYVYVDGQIDFDRIISKSKRKTMLRIDLEQAEIVAPEGSHALDSFSNQTGYERKDFSSRSNTAKPYIIYAKASEKKLRIAFEPNEKMLSLMKQKSPRKISLD
jgi:hypothetical protein